MTETHTKNDVQMHEYIMHKYIYELEIVNVPKIISYDYHNKIMIMENIKGISISDYYGEEDYNVDESIYKRIHKIIKRLYDNGIEYPDITGYNFIETNNGIWIIDFEHARFIDTNKKDDDKHTIFIKQFINGFNGWNPEFK